MNSNSKIIYSPRYDLLANGLGKLHPFDVRKYSKGWHELERQFGTRLKSHWVEPEQVIANELLLNIHTGEYIESLAKSSQIARILEVPLARFIPRKVLDKYILQPMKYACEGTRLATEYALEGAMAMNMGGGYHHAFADHGEGFCVYADAAVAIGAARKQGALGASDKVLMIDLDAHRGNGFNAIAAKDKAIEVFDMYNFQAYPGMYEGSVEDNPFMVPLKSQTSDETYLAVLKEELPKFIDAVATPRLAYYNAGTDILQGDSLGNLNVSYAGVVERDRYVIELLKSNNIPVVIMTSGGYTKQSYKLVANQAAMLLKA